MGFQVVSPGHSSLDKIELPRSDEDLKIRLHDTLSLLYRQLMWKAVAGLHGSNHSVEFGEIPHAAHLCERSNPTINSDPLYGFQ